MEVGDDFEGRVDATGSDSSGAAVNNLEVGEDSGGRGRRRWRKRLKAWSEICEDSGLSGDMTQVGFVTVSVFQYCTYVVCICPPSTSASGRWNPSPISHIKLSRCLYIRSFGTEVGGAHRRFYFDVNTL